MSRKAAFRTLDRFVKKKKKMVIKAGLKLNAFRIIGKRKLSLLRIYHNISGE